MKRIFALERSDGPTLRCAVWQAAEPRGAVLVTPGYAESIERWEQAAEQWLAAGFCVAVYDLRGQGRSEGRRGHVERFEDFTGDLFAVLDELESVRGWQALSPVVAFGHSLGALISTVAALERPDRFRGLALASPFFGLAIKPAPWKLLAARLLTNLWPTFSEGSQVDVEVLTHDKERQQAMQRDALRIKTVSARWFTETEAARARILAEFASLQLPVYCQAAGDDRIADVSVTQHVFNESTHAQQVLKVWPGAYHELHQEIERVEHLRRFQTQFEAWYSLSVSKSG